MIDTSRRHVMTGTLAAIAAGSTVNLAAAAMPPAPDPIFAAIERHRAARKETQKCFDATSGMDDDHARPAIAPAMQVLDEVERAMCATVPTTAAGAVTLLSYIRETESGGLYILESTENLDALLSSIESTFRQMAGLPGGNAVTKQTVAPQPDPIFAAIDNHKTLFLRQMEAGRVYSDTHTNPRLPGYDRAVDLRNSAADQRARLAEEKAARELATVRPQTLAGALALMQYIEQFNAGAFKLHDDPKNWFSMPMLWPTREDADGIDLFPFDLLSNVAAGLAQITGGSAVRS